MKHTTFSLSVLFSYVSGPQRVSDFVESIGAVAVDFFLVTSAYVQCPQTTSMLLGNAYERGAMDSHYRCGRAVNPDYLIAPEDETVQMTAAEITAYTAGFDNNEMSGDKMYVTEHDESYGDGEQVEEVEMRIDTSFIFNFEIRQDLLGS